MNTVGFSGLSYSFGPILVDEDYGYGYSYATEDAPPIPIPQIRTLELKNVDFNLFLSTKLPK